MEFEHPVAQPIGLMEKNGKKLLTDGVLKLEQGQEAYIGPLASCYGIVIPIENEGAILAHIASDNNAKIAEYFTQIETDLKKIPAEKLKQVFIFYKDNDPGISIIDKIAELFKDNGLKICRKFAYKLDKTYVKVDSAQNEVTVGPMDGDELTPKRGFHPYTEKY